MKCPYCDYESRVVSEFCVNCRHKLDVDNNKENIKGQLNAYKWYSPRKKHLRNGLSNASKLTRASIQEEKPLYKVWVQNSCEAPCHTLMHGQKVPFDDDFLVVNDSTGAVGLLSYPGEYGHSVLNSECCSCSIEFCDNGDNVLSNDDKECLLGIAKVLQSRT